MNANERELLLKNEVYVLHCVTTLVFGARCLSTA